MGSSVLERGGCYVITAAGPRPSATVLGPDGSRFRLSALRSERGARLTTTASLRAVRTHPFPGRQRERGAAPPSGGAAR